MKKPIKTVEPRMTRMGADEEPSPSALSAKSAVKHPGVRTLALADLDAMPVPVAPSRHLTLADMSADDLGAMVRGLDQARTTHESLSGTCAVLAGLALIEAKKRVPRGEYLPWVKTHLGKSKKTAAHYVKMARAFVKSNPSGLHLEQQTLALMDGSQTLAEHSLDLTHPAVAAVARWAAGRSFYQLREEFARGHTPGGKTYERVDGKGARQKLTLAETLKLLREVNKHALEHFRFLHDKKSYVAAETDKELDLLIDHADECSKVMKAWRKMTKTEREAALAEVLKQKPAKGAKG